MIIQWSHNNKTANGTWCRWSNNNKWVSFTMKKIYFGTKTSGLYSEGGLNSNGSL